MKNLKDYTIQSVQERVVNEAMKAGFNSKHANLISRVRIRSDYLHTAYHVSYFKSGNAKLEDEVTDVLISSAKSDILTDLAIESIANKNNEDFRLGLCVITLDVEMNYWPMLYLEYEITAKEKQC